VNDEIVCGRDSRIGIGGIDGIREFAQNHPVNGKQKQFF
jgi:hypothetical protein